MDAGRIISDQYFAISPGDTIRFVLEKMAEYRLGHLPVVKGEILLGLVSESLLLEHQNEHATISDANIPYLQVQIFEQQHLYDAILFFQLYHIDILPVIDNEHHYLGAITEPELINGISASMSISQPGSIIVLEMGSRDNALSHIAHIVESDNAQILNSNVQSFPESNTIEVTIKINKSDISAIVAGFLRYDYTIKNTYNDESNDDNARDRYEHFMNYINM